MPLELKGRRIPIINLGTQPEPMVGEMPVLELAGDYCGPFKDKIKGVLVLYYLLPVARDADKHGHARSVHHLVSPPHRIIEEPDGSLTIRESIGSPDWHGFLNAGSWELTKRPTQACPT